MIFFLASKLLNFITKLFSKRRYEYPSEISDEDAVRNLNFLAHSLRKIKQGGPGVSLFPISFAVKQGYKTALQKEKEGIPLYPFEKWLKDNYRLLYGSFKSLSNDSFVSLPHVDGVPRVCILADFIVKYSGKTFSRDKTESVIKTFSAVTPLTFPELERMKDALIYRLLWEISTLAERSVFYFANYLKAGKKKFSQKDSQKDSYLAYYSKRNAAEAEAIAERSPEIDFSSSVLGFENVIAANEYLASLYVSALRSVSSFFPKGSSAKLSPANEIYSSDQDYRLMSDGAKEDYLRLTYELSRRFQTTEIVVARAAVRLGEEWKIHFGSVLYKQTEGLRAYLKSGEVKPMKEEGRKVQGVYCTLVLSIALLLAAFPAYYLRTILSYCAVIPFFIALLHPVEYLLKRMLGLRKGKKPVPQMDYEKLPESSKTVVAVSRFITSEKDVDDALRQIEVLAASYKDENVFYCVVSDLPKSNEEWSDADESLFRYAQEKRKSENVCFLIRKRIKQQGGFGGYERKRGALLDFLSAVKDGNFDRFYLTGKMPQGYFAVLLDDDSEVLPGTIRAAILAMSHPLNAEYELLSFGGKINRYSLTTYYSDKFSRSCTVEAYPFYSDFYSENFDCALYCGKAIVRIEPYVRKLRDFFPDNRILSHDIIEGAVLRSSSLKRSVYEDAPKTFVSDVNRESRWQRGDVQLLPYALCPSVRKKNGEKTINPIAPIYKLVIFINGLSVLSDACLFAVGVAAVFLRSFFLLYYAISILLFAYAYSLIASFGIFRGKIRFRYALRSVSYSFGNLAERAFLCPFRALNGIILFGITVFKMATHSKDLLSWTPFKTTQNAGSYRDGTKVALPSVIISAALTVWIGNFYFTLYAFFFCLTLFYLIFLGKEKKQRSIDRKEDALLKDYAKDIYAYFRDSSGPHLISDNLQLYPYRMQSDMTSPTNIGFAVLSEISAALLAIVSEEEAFSNVSAILDQVDKLEKWNGHLYNWYDVRTFAVKEPRVVSTVDSANFVACLMVAYSFAEERGEQALAERLKKMYEAVYFPALYDEENKALVIARNVPENKNYGRYDLLASESRIAYYFAVGQGVDPECYFSLGRECSPEFGNTLLSWSGTAFEYMLPRIFLSAPEGSLLFEQERNSFRVQESEKSEGVFGRSECGYSELNDKSAYRYKAIGAKGLALSEECADVIAPYASFLYLPVSFSSCVDNLRRLEEKGARGKYGFYEAIDYDAGGRLVQSFMTHHQGMSLAAIANAETADEIARLFMRVPQNASIRLLLAEDNIVSKQAKTVFECGRKEENYQEDTPLPDLTNVFAEKEKNYTIVADGLGRSFSAYKGKSVNKYLSYIPSAGGFFFQIKEDKTLFSPTFFPCECDGCEAYFVSDGIRYENSEKKVEESLYLLADYDGEMRKLTFRNDEETVRSLTVSGYCDLILNDRDAYDSHPAYSDMFVRTEINEKKEIAFAMRKNSRCEIELTSVCGVKGLEDLAFNTNRYNVVRRKDPMGCDFAEGVARKDSPIEGDVLYPCFSFSGTIRIEPHSERSIYVFMLCAEEKAELEKRCEKLDFAFRSGALDLIGKRRKDKLFSFESASLGAILLNERPSDVALSKRLEIKDFLAGIGVEENEKIVYYEAKDGGDFENSVRLAYASELLSRCGIKNRLVIGVNKVEGAGMNSVERLKKTILTVSDRTIVLPLTEISDLRSAAWVRFPLDLEAKKNSSIQTKRYAAPLPSEISPILLESGEGGFTENGFSVRPFDGETLLPYSNVVGGRKGGFVVTENGCGFTFGQNAREDKLTIWTGDALYPFSSERVVLSAFDKRYLLSEGTCVHKIGSTSYSCRIGKFLAVLNVYLAEGGSAKIFEVILPEETDTNVSISLELYPALGWRRSEQIFLEKFDRGYRMTNAENGKSCFLCSLDSELIGISPEKTFDPFAFHVSGRAGKGVYRLVLSSEESALTSETLSLSRAETEAEIMKNAITVHSPDPALDLLYNQCLPYQAQSARLNAKTGFYQVSGAFGFRDQLQDALSCLISDPMRVREQILLSAAHQFEEGDVQHWWHSPRTGVRTRISDDRLWLCFVTQKYIEVTEDYSILDESVSFLKSDPLRKEENSRYEIPRVSDPAPLSEHLKRAIEVSLSYGEHGLLKIGSGDWNDGLDRVGEKGRGESVWLTEFAYACITGCMRFFKEEDRARFSKEAEKLSSALKPLQKNGRYPAAFADDGSWLGYSDTPKCTLSLNPQTWAVLSGAVRQEDAIDALECSRELVDERNGLIKLLTPPFDKDSNYGYIASYPKGVRENGGQYTHAAVWYLKALLKIGRGEEAYKILTFLNPIERCRDRERAILYKAEPYVLAGDVYAVSPYIGRAGWSWYSGSAAWLKYVLTEDFFGVKKRGDKIYFDPCLPVRFEGVKIDIKIDRKVISVFLKRGKEKKTLFRGEERSFISLSECLEKEAVTVIYPAE